MYVRRLTSSSGIMTAILSRDGNLFQKLIDNFLGGNSLGFRAHGPNEPMPQRIGSDALDVCRKDVIAAREKSRGARHGEKVLRRARRSTMKNHFLDNRQAGRLAVASGPDDAYDILAQSVADISPADDFAIANNIAGSNQLAH